MFKPRLTTLLHPRGPRPRLRTTSTRHLTSNNSSTPSPQSRADRILARLPAPMQNYTACLRGAPVSHIVAFLVLHELTAVVPLAALFGLFHYTDFVPLGYMTEHYGGSVREGMGRYERYFTRKGWFGFGAEEGAGTDRLGGEKADTGGEGEGNEEAVMDRWESPDRKYRIVVEIGLAYAVTKVLLPARILVSLWATPWFAGLLARIRGTVSLAKK